ncbi:Nramp family divalent metal transporter [Paraburkholderia tropica]|uniref:Nramp family divalent metal transporter n=1 Tax=Paraburkholderia tropica TaxID=92647 RepID=UPI002AB63E6A|nr:Nramp family divalent metal transporter [Paraburkholderia tropica]
MRHTYLTVHAIRPSGFLLARLRRRLKLFGPAFVAAVAYIDPGNYATNIAAGSEYGYTLLWTVLWSGLVGMYVQMLSSRLGIATRHSLAALLSERLPPWGRYLYWLQAEFIAIVTEFAEFTGACLGFHLVSGCGMPTAASVTAVLSVLILAVEHRGIKPLEFLVGIMLAAVAGLYIGELVLGRPDLRQTLSGLVVPRLSGPGSIVAAAGILGATVMPHVIYLHSSLSQNDTVRYATLTPRKLLRFSCYDILMAMTLAMFVNVAMLAVAAAVFHAKGLERVAGIEDAWRTLPISVGGWGTMIFGVSLVLAGLSSTVVGTLAGQRIMQDFLQFSVSLWLRRAVTMAPSLVVIALHLDISRVIVATQVVLSFGIVFALVPLLVLTSNTALMGPLRSRPASMVVGIVCVGVVTALNVALLWETI